MQQSWAKRNLPLPVQSNPCTAPTKFVEARVQQIQALEASVSPKVANTLAGLIQQFQGKTAVDTSILEKISQLRREANGVNNLLRADGCKPIDLDKELAPRAPEPGHSGWVTKTISPDGSTQPGTNTGNPPK
jgi:hypothetical protein